MRSALEVESRLRAGGRWTEWCGRRWLWQARSRWRRSGQPGGSRWPCWCQRRACRQHLETFRQRFDAYPSPRVSSRSSIRRSSARRWPDWRPAGWLSSAASNCSAGTSFQASPRRVDEEQRSASRPKRLRAAHRGPRVTGRRRRSTNAQHGARGVRDMSVIETPPKSLDIKTRVAEASAGWSRPSCARSTAAARCSRSQPRRADRREASSCALLHRRASRSLTARCRRAAGARDAGAPAASRGLVCKTIIESGLDIPSQHDRHRTAPTRSAWARSTAARARGALVAARPTLLLYRRRRAAVRCGAQAAAGDLQPSELGAGFQSRVRLEIRGDGQHPGRRAATATWRMLA